MTKCGYISTLHSKSDEVEIKLYVRICIQCVFALRFLGNWSFIIIIIYVLIFTLHSLKDIIYYNLDWACFQCLFIYTIFYPQLPSSFALSSIQSCKTLTRVPLITLTYSCILVEMNSSLHFYTRRSALWIVCILDIIKLIVTMLIKLSWFQFRIRAFIDLEIIWTNHSKIFLEKSPIVIHSFFPSTSRLSLI